MITIGRFVGQQDLNGLGEGHFHRRRVQHIPRKRLLASELTTLLLAACRQSVVSRTENSQSFNLSVAASFLRDKGFEKHIVFHQPRGKHLRLYSELSNYAINNLIVRRLTIDLDKPLVGNSHGDWEIMAYGLKVHFEHCKFIPKSPNSATLEFPWSGRFRFLRNDFTFSGSGNRGWLLVFGSMSDVAFHRNRFFESDMDLISHRKSSDSRVQKLSWENHSAYLLKDESFFRAMIRRTHELPESARLTTVDSHYSTPHVGLWRVTLVANTGIRRVCMRCSAKHYAFRGRNEIQSLHFDEPRTDMKDTVVYLGSRERIDPDLLSPLHHRELLLSLRDLADARGDRALVSRLERCVDRIEYFLTKECKVSVHDGVAAWIEYWQDRIRHSWRRWSSDFYGSWMRPLFLGIVGYAGLNALAWFWIEAFTITDWVAFSLRRVDRIPFYTAGLEDVHQIAYDGLTPGNKNWLRLIGLVQNVWIAMYGFAFSKAIRR